MNDSTQFTKRILKTWWPLAFSWLLMGVEVPALSAVIARLSNPEINLAAYGGVVYPISLIVEAPIIMLLAASVALSKDWASYIRIRKFMMVAGAALTVVHILVAFTPLYYVVVRQLIGVPEEIVEPARIGLMVMTPWTWSIAYRRFQQGVLIRYGHAREVGIGTVVRLITGGTVLAVGYALHSSPGILVGATAQALGVISEAVYAGWRVRPVLREQVRLAAPVPLMSWSEFYSFYIPLALTSLLSLLWQPIGSAALSRMDHPLESLAVWPVVSGLVFILRSFGFAYNEVVVAVLDEPNSTRSLRRFTGILAGSTSGLHLLIAATPLALFWFQRISALRPELAQLAILGFWIAFPMTGLSVLQSWYQGAIVQGKRTRGIPESMGIFLVTVLVVLGIGVSLKSITGLYVGMVAFMLANLTQTLWLWVRSRPVMKIVQDRDGIISGGLAVENIQGD